MTPAWDAVEVQPSTVRISDRWEPWQPDGGWMDSAGMVHTPLSRDPILAVTCPTAHDTPFPEAEASSSRTQGRAPPTPGRGVVTVLRLPCNYSKATEADSSSPGTPQRPLIFVPGLGQALGMVARRSVGRSVLQPTGPSLHSSKGLPCPRDPLSTRPLPWLPPCLVHPPPFLQVTPPAAQATLPPGSPGCPTLVPPPAAPNRLWMLTGGHGAWRVSTSSLGLITAGFQ